MKTQTISRRAALGTTAAALAAAQLPRFASAAQRAVQGGGGVAGGGSVQLADGSDASFSVFATRLTDDAGSPPLILGTVLLSAGGQMYASTNVTDYGPDEDNPDARHIEGFLSIDGSGNHPFVVNL